MMVVQRSLRSAGASSVRLTIVCMKKPWIIGYPQSAEVDLSSCVGVLTDLCLFWCTEHNEIF